jgi:hypothetical protein
VDERELVGLLYRADWTRLALTGTVRGHDLADTLSMVMDRSGAWAPPWAPRIDDEDPSGESFGPAPFSGEMTVTVAPGRRYRLATASGSRVRGCDGERTWEWLRDRQPGVRIKVSEQPEPPAGVLLAPSWLLSGHRLVIDDADVVACGRAGIRITAEPTGAGRLAGHVSEIGMFMRAPRYRGYQRVTAVVDAELGFLLSCAYQDDGADFEVAEFTELAVGPEAAADEFTAPPGSTFADEAAFSRADFVWGVGPFGGLGWDAAKTVGGLAAGALGVAIRLTPARRPDPFAQATSADDDLVAAMPADLLPDSVLGWLDGGGPEPDLPSVSDEVLHLLYRCGVTPVPFTAALHEWADGVALLGATPESVRRAGFGGVGFLVDSALARVEAAGPVVHLRREIRFGGPTRYRVDKEAGESGDARRASGDSDWTTAACDGERIWEVYQDRVETGLVGSPGLSSPLPGALATMADGSWLLGCRLFGGQAAEVAGRPGYAVMVIGNGRHGRAPDRAQW